MARQEKEIERLQAIRQHTLEEIERLKQELQAEVEPTSATDDDSAAEAAADIYERGKIVSLIQSLEAKVHSLERAIELAEQGKYGICEKCGSVIPKERLEIMPETTLCVRCASELEQGIRRHQLRADATEELLTEELEEDENDLGDL